MGRKKGVKIGASKGSLHKMLLESKGAIWTESKQSTIESIAFKYGLDLTYSSFWAVNIRTGESIKLNRVINNQRSKGHADL